AEAGVAATATPAATIRSATNRLSFMSSSTLPSSADATGFGGSGSNAGASTPLPPATSSQARIRWHLPSAEDGGDLAPVSYTPRPMTGTALRWWLAAAASVVTICGPAGAKEASVSETVLGNTLRRIDVGEVTL